MIRRRLRTFTLWIGTLLSLLIVAAFVASAWWEIGLQVPTPYGPSIDLMGGVVFVTNDLGPPSAWAATHSHGLVLWNLWSWESGPPYTASGVHIIEFPLYAVFLAVAVPTMLVWRFWPKPVKAGHCRCGYDLTGNVSGVCPECGQSSSGAT